MEDHPKGAILQRDKKTCAIVPRTPVGIVTPDDPESIGRVQPASDAELTILPTPPLLICFVRSRQLFAVGALRLKKR